MRHYVIAAPTVAAAVLATCLSGGIDHASAATPANLVLDPEFSHGTAAWKAAGAALSTLPGYGSHTAVRVTNTSGQVKTMNLNDKVNTVAETTKGTHYTASAYIRTSAPGFTAAVREGEWAGSVSKQAARIASSTLSTTAWRKVSVTLTAASDGASIDLNILAWKVPRGVSFEVAEPMLTSDGVVAVSTPPPPPPVDTTAHPSIASPGYKLVWNDEFNGSSVDATKWNTRNNSCGGNEYSVVTNRSSNVFVAGGVLTLRGLRENYSACGVTRNYTSGYLDTIGKHSWTNGRFEMRAMMPTTKGSWPAFWLRNDHTSGEIDVLEAIGGKTGYTQQTVIQNTMTTAVKKGHGDIVSGGVDSWHTYGVTKTDDTLTFDVDGQVVFTVLASNTPWFHSSFDDSMNIRLNQQIGGAMPRYFDSDVDATSVFAADFKVDYIRVYQV